jgi:hypothetical protein
MVFFTIWQFFQVFEFFDFIEIFLPGMDILPRKSTSIYGIAAAKKKTNRGPIGKTYLRRSRIPTMVAELPKASSKSRVRTVHAKGAECSPCDSQRHVQGTYQLTSSTRQGKVRHDRTAL